jgi:hypothetical protein
MQIAVIRIDLSKNSTRFIGTGRQAVRSLATRKLASGPPAYMMAVETCCGTHHQKRKRATHSTLPRLLSRFTRSHRH